MVKSLEESNQLIREAVAARLAGRAVSEPLPEKLVAEVPQPPPLRHNPDGSSTLSLCVIGLAGNIGSGKSEAARMIPGACHLQWADPIYRAVAAMLEVPESLLRDRATKEEPLPVWDIDVVPRMLTRTLGTEWGRMTVHPDLWVNLTLRAIDKARRSTGATVFAVCGTRFTNEVDAIRSLGGEVWWVDRPGTMTGPHVSDKGLTAADCDRVIVNNGDLARLRHNVETAFADCIRRPQTAS